MRTDSGARWGCPTPILPSYDLGYNHNGWSSSSHFQQGGELEPRSQCCTDREKRDLYNFYGAPTPALH